MENKRKYAIYGGSFDPVHIGHVALAKSAAEECGLDRLIFMPAHVSPFKQGREAAAEEDRCGMIEAVLPEHSSFCLSRYEITKEGPSYTVETLRHWSVLLGGSLSFVLGFDSAVQIDTWYMGDEILRDYPLITGLRPGTDDREGLRKIEELRREYGADITVLDMEPVDASSSHIRELLKAGKPVKGLVPAAVEEYILEHKLYR